MNIRWLQRGRRIDDYLIDKNNLIRLVLFTALFSLVFINLYKPFNSESWYPVSSIGYFFISFLIVLTGIIVIAISRYLMYLFVRRYSLYYTEYALWVFLEVFILSGFYTWYTIAVRPDLTYWDWKDVTTVFKDATMNTCLVIFLPYAASWLFFSLSDKKAKLRALEQQRGSTSPSKLLFADEKGEMRFSAPSANVVFLEAADNYVEINYINQNKLTKYLVRNTLKKMESQLQQTSIQRCHRSYMVNFERVAALRRDGDEIDLEFDVPNIKKIPVSKTYRNAVTELFLAYCKP